MKRRIAGIIGLVMFILTTIIAVFIPLEINPMTTEQMVFIIFTVLMGYFATALYAAVYFNKL
jgi:uncharacterized membrane protein